ncbi:MAG: hypothetical protein LW832_03560 [Parachlamydia sp.]|jgi:hypothetical protein|nr:hypothetical protein [Parachlamydia sp.]
MSDVGQVGGSSTPTYTNYAESPVFQSLPTEIKDTLIRSFTTNELNERFIFTPSDAPVLVSPNLVLSSSLDDFFKILSDAKMTQRQQFAASDFIDQLTRRKDSRLAGLAALSMVDQFKVRDTLAAQNTTNTQNQMNSIQALINSIVAETSAQNALINNVNAGTTAENAASQALVSAYNDYTANLGSNGITNDGNGNFTIPAGKESIYNSLTTTYQTAVNSYNSFRAVKFPELQNYNSSTLAYNNSAASNNNQLQTFITAYNLQATLDAQNVDIEQPSATTRDTSGYVTPQTAPSLFPGTGPASVYTYPPSAFLDNIAASGAPTIPSLPPQQAYDITPLKSTITKKNYDATIGPLDEQIINNVLYWGFLNALRVFDPVRDYTPDPLLNIKPMTRKVAPNTIIDPVAPVQSPSTAAGALSVQSIGVGSPHINGLLGKGALQQAVRNLGLNLNEEQIQELANELLVLSVGLISANSGEALLPSLEPLLALVGLPKDSPLFSLLFSISFANRIQEGIGQGLTLEALKAFVQGSPLLQNLSEADLAALVASLNLGLLLVSSKLIESSLGLPGLTAQLTLPSLPPEVSTGLVEEASSSSQKASDNLKTQLRDYFTEQGFKPEEADFLSDFGTRLAKEDLGGPSAPIISERREIPPEIGDSATDDVVTGYEPYINEEVLKDSVKSSLILSEGRDYDLAKADRIAKEAIKRTFEDNEEAVSAQQFRTSLESNLRDLGVRSSVATEVSKEAILIPPRNETLKPEVSPAPFQPLSETDIISVLTKRAEELITARLGAQLNKKITEELSKTLFGIANPDSRDIAQVKSPVSLVNQVKDQLEELDVYHEREYQAVLRISFIETILTSVDFYAFSLKIMDPAYSLIYSANISPMYAGHEPSNWKKSIDIIV